MATKVVRSARMTRFTKINPRTTGGYEIVFLLGGDPISTLYVDNLEYSVSDKIHNWMRSGALVSDVNELA